MSVRVTVNMDRINKLNQNLSRGEINGILDDTCKEISDEMYGRAHEITGFMKSTIGHETSGYTGRVFATAEYAIYEKNRGGDHDFVTEPVDNGEKILVDKIKELVKG